MFWDTWALIAIVALCLSVFVWGCWGSYCESREDDARPLRLTLATGGYLEIRVAGGNRGGGRHRGRSRGPQRA